ncbi:MAG: multimeric flavodoxin WrbA [Oceanicoccus sp.]|jgi:multimeric flavodoxin WrbA
MAFSNMKRILIVYHSQSGSTKRLADAVAEGARLESGVDVRQLRAMEAGINDLLWCDGVIFGTPENLGYMSGGLKDFFDRVFYPALSASLNLPYGLFVCAGNDGSGAIRQLQRIVKGIPLKCIAETVVARGEVKMDDLQRCRDLGQGTAAGLNLGIF